jgi:hypothetical protein
LIPKAVQLDEHVSLNPTERLVLRRRLIRIKARLALVCHAVSLDELRTTNRAGKFTQRQAGQFEALTCGHRPIQQTPDLQRTPSGTLTRAYPQLGAVVFLIPELYLKEDRTDRDALKRPMATQDK